MKWRALMCASAGVFALPFLALAYTSPGAPTGHINDFANIVSADARSSLESSLSALATQTGIEVAVAVVPSLQGDYIENVAVQLFEEWGIGSAEKNDGVLILLAIEDRELRIETGYGAEALITDGEADTIIRTVMVPRLRDGDYAGAISEGVAAVSAQIRDPSLQLSPEPEPSVNLDSESIMYVIGFVIMLMQWIAAVLARSKSWWAGGIAGALIGAGLSTFLGWWIFGGLAVVALLTVIGLALDYAVSNAYGSAREHHTSPPWWAGGPGRSGSSGGGGFGGFGGGRSGGGGASGRW